MTGEEFEWAALDIPIRYSPRDVIFLAMVFMSQYV
jgi:hypothetical protein